jgi:protein gp37
MASTTTTIAWTDATWNPVRGCSKVSAGCTNCYAEKVAARFCGPGLPYEGLARDGHWTGDVRCLHNELERPLHWRKPRRVFVNSMSDLFHEAVPFSFIAEVFNVMVGEASASPQPHHTYQVLTKRASRMRLFFDWCRAGGDGSALATMLQATLEVRGCFPRVWLGVTAEDQAAADERIPHLLATPAAVRWVSVEPMIGPVDFDCWPESGCPRGWLDETPGIDWVVIGAESGPGYRRCDTAWAQSLAAQCREAGIPNFVKQLHADRGLIRSLSQFPVDLRAREYPEPRPHASPGTREDGGR